MVTRFLISQQLREFYLAGSWARHFDGWRERERWNSPRFDVVADAVDRIRTFADTQQKFGFMVPDANKYPGRMRSVRTSTDYPWRRPTEERLAKYDRANKQIATWLSPFTRTHPRAGASALSYQDRNVRGYWDDRMRSGSYQVPRKRMLDEF